MSWILVLNCSMKNQEYFLFWNVFPKFEISRKTLIRGLCFHPQGSREQLIKIPLFRIFWISGAPLDPRRDPKRLLFKPSGESSLRPRTRKTYILRPTKSFTHSSLRLTNIFTHSSLRPTEKTRTRPIKIIFHYCNWGCLLMFVHRYQSS